MTVASGASFLRLGKDSQSSISSLGPLADLIGTWTGSHGWNVIAVPHGRNFKLLVRPYFETITFSSFGAPAPDRGGPGDIFITGLQYDIRIADLESNQPMHFENGMWLFLDPANNPNSLPLARQASIPHGNVVLAVGDFSVLKGPPRIPDRDTTPTTGKPIPIGYLDPYLTPIPGVKQLNPNQNLQSIVKTQTVLQTIVLDVSTRTSGGIQNIPFIVKNANATTFKATYWIETVKDQVTGETFQQLQYSQQTDLEFLPRFDDHSKLIIWPHMNINTLLKQ